MPDRPPHRPRRQLTPGARAALAVVGVLLGVVLIFVGVGIGLSDGDPAPAPTTTIPTGPTQGSN